MIKVLIGTGIVVLAFIAENKLHSSAVKRDARTLDLSNGDNGTHDNIIEMNEYMRTMYEGSDDDLKAFLKGKWRHE